MSGPDEKPPKPPDVNDVVKAGRHATLERGAGEPIVGPGTNGNGKGNGRQRGQRRNLRVVEKAKPDTDDWRGKLTVDERKGGHAKTLHNAVVILTHDSRWEGVLGYDERGDRPMFLAPPPFAPDYAGEDKTIPREIRDADAARASMWIEREFDLAIGSKTMHEAIATAVLQKPYDPVRDYLSPLAWDGQARLDAWLCTYFGVADTPYARAVGAKWLISAVARTFEPGCKADCALVFEGAQGVKKSSGLRALAGADHFTDEIPDLGNKDAAIQVVGKWIIEISELDAMSRTEVSSTKAFLSRQVDRYRSPYGRRAEDHPRRCIFAGSTNEGTYLRDSTGNRRFWPVACGASIDVHGLGAARDQLWAEAVARYRTGETWWLDQQPLVDAAREEQEHRYQGDEWEEVVRQYVSTPPVTLEDEIPAWKILLDALKIERGKWSQADMNRVARCLQRLGWTKVRGPQTADGKRPWVYRRPSASPSSEVGQGREVGQGKPSDPAVCPSSPSSPSSSTPYAPARVNARAEDGSPDPGGTTRTSRTSRTDPSQQIDFDLVDSRDFQDDDWAPPPDPDDCDPPDDGGEGNRF